ncbi:C-C chemokine receptor type 9 [Merluccius polli]|uniref:C-C chemokine receptor type 9 n=1 Tax=Merluccius polli TaxID=89951 RepID=A0AA47N2X7_MERPO|nr:C-C chemokine receptor type 9 [Merluccius polli]
MLEDFKQQLFYLFPQDSSALDFASMATTEDYYYYNESDEFYCDRSPVRAFRAQYEPPLYWTITVVGGLGNLMVVWTYLHFRKRLKTMTDIYLLNLAVADLLFLGTLPLWATEATQGWAFGLGLCKVNSALYKINLFSSTLLLTCISVDRYVVIVETTAAQNSKIQRLRYSKLVCGAVWLLALFLALPEFIFSTTKAYEDKDYCRMVFSGGVGNNTKVLVLALQVSMGFCLPFLIMAFCYSVIICTLLKTRNFGKHKAMRVILVVVAVFILTQLPYNCSLVLEATLATNVTMANCEQVKRSDIAGQVLKSLAYAHASVNPFLFAFVGVRFQKDMVGVLRAYGCWPSKCPFGNFGNKSPWSRASMMSEMDTTATRSNPPLS